MTTPPDELGYAAALNELQRILAELERSDIDVDQLATRVERAGELIATCRQRIERARVQIEQVVGDPADLHDGGDVTSGTEPS